MIYTVSPATTTVNHPGRRTTDSRLADDSQVRRPAFLFNRRQHRSQERTRSVVHDRSRYQIFAITCPFHDDAFWAALKEHSPAEWADAVAFDHAIRNGSARANADGHPLRGSFFLHASRVPLDEVVLRPRRILYGERPGCGPWTCPHPEPAGAGAGRREVA